MAEKVEPQRTSFSRIRSALAYRFNLRPDQSDFTEIDRNIRDGIEVRGTNLWVLMLAIFIASIGLNVNSTAVVIGAMLISPLMGPIMGVGYGVGINDYLLIRRALSNLLISIAIALFTSTCYFLATPLSAAQSELLARTTPTIWDVLIALFGGLAGIIAVTRKEKSNVIPGVAIATALMPPLCTAGYGIANHSLDIFFGAFYLFFINCVFIALATLLLVGYINPPHKRFVSKQLEQRVKRYIYIVVLATLFPSIYLAYGLVTRELFISRSNEFIKNEMVFENSFVAKQKISPDKHLIDVTFAGQKVGDDRLSELSRKLARYRLADAKLVVHQAVIKELDVNSLRKSLLTDILSSNQQAFDTKNQQIAEQTRQIQQLQSRIAELNSWQSAQAEQLKTQRQIRDEFIAQYPQVQNLLLARAAEYRTGEAAAGTVLLVNVESKTAFSGDEKRRIVAWLKVRAGVDSVRLTVNSPMPKKRPN